MEETVILAIDDSYDLVMLEKIILENAGYNVHTALSGKEALKKAEGLSKLDLILLDCQLGDMSGADFVKDLEFNNPKIFKNTPIVLVTGLDEKPDIPAVGWVKKMPRPDQFLKEVQGFLKK